MNSITREFWYGNILPQNDCRPKTDEMKQLSDLIIKNRNDLILSMNKEQMAIFDKLDACLAEYATITEETIFAYGFKLGIRMASEAHEERFEK